MKEFFQSRLRVSQSSLTALILIAVMLGIFVFDTVTDYAIAAASFHICIILIAVRLLSRRTVIWFAWACVILTIVSFYLTRSGDFEVGLINTIISIIAIIITTYLGLLVVSAQAAAHKTREHLLRLARVTTLGQLTASIAHEINQPLAAIATSANACNRWLSFDPPNVEKAQAAVERIAGEAHRASEVLQRMRSLARGEETKKTIFDLNQSIAEIVSLSQREIDNLKIETELSLPQNLSLAYADKIQVQQVLGNLVLNALDAIAQHNPEQKLLEIIAAQENQRFLSVTIKDNGTGLSHDAQEQLFDAFYTTKTGGFGLGLTICRSIIEANGGQISVKSTLGQGTEMKFTLPAVKG